MYQADVLIRRMQAVHGDPRISVMLGVAIVMGYVYQGPPFRLTCQPAYYACFDSTLTRTSLQRHVCSPLLPAGLNTITLADGATKG